MFIKDYKQYGDVIYSRKHLLPQYDVAISTRKDQLMMLFINPTLIREFIEKQK
jgi:hypothetical protein